MQEGLLASAPTGFTTPTITVSSPASKPLFLLPHLLVRLPNEMQHVVSLLNMLGSASYVLRESDLQDLDLPDTPLAVS